MIYNDYQYFIHVINDIVAPAQIVELVFCHHEIKTFDI